MKAPMGANQVYISDHLSASCAKVSDEEQSFNAINWGLNEWTNLLWMIQLKLNINFIEHQVATRYFIYI